MIGFSFSERLHNTYWELEYSEVETENVEKATKLLLKRLNNCDHSELTEEEAEIICYAFSDVEYAKKEAELKEIVAQLKPKTEYQVMALEFIHINLRDNCLDEVIFYLKDAFDIEYNDR